MNSIKFDLSIFRLGDVLKQMLVSSNVAVEVGNESQSLTINIEPTDSYVLNTIVDNAVTALISSELVDVNLTINGSAINFPSKLFVTTSKVDGFVLTNNGSVTAVITLIHA